MDAGDLEGYLPLLIATLWLRLLSRIRNTLLPPLTMKLLSLHCPLCFPHSPLTIFTPSTTTATAVSKITTTTVLFKKITTATWRVGGRSSMTSCENTLVPSNSSSTPFTSLSSSTHVVLDQNDYACQRGVGARFSLLGGLVDDSGRGSVLIGIVFAFIRLGSCEICLFWEIKIQGS